MTKFTQILTTITCCLVIGVCIYGFFKFGNIFDQSEQIKRIEESQKQLNNHVDQILKFNVDAVTYRDSVNAIHIRKIDSINTVANATIIQIRAANKKIGDIKKIFDENRVDLPDPDK